MKLWEFLSKLPDDEELEVIVECPEIEDFDGDKKGVSFNVKTAYVGSQIIDNKRMNCLIF